MARGAVRWVAWWVVLAAFWLLLVDTPKLPELVTGAVGAALGATVGELIEEQRPVGMRLRLSWLRRLPRALARLPLDTGVLCAALARRLLRGQRVSGAFRAIRFEAGGDDPAATGRRVLAKALDSLGPNSYVIGIDSEEEVMLVHQLVPPADPASADPMELR